MSKSERFEPPTLQFSPCAFCERKSTRIVNNDYLGSVVVYQCKGQPIKLLEPETICLQNDEALVGLTKKS